MSNLDPLGMGRLMISVADVAGLVPSNWALPCVPALGLQLGVLAVPMVGAGVWVEFEQGDMNHPVWTGCYPGGPLDIPITAQPVLIPGTPAIPAFVVQTPLQNALVVSDLPPAPAMSPMPPPAPVPGGIVLRSASGAMIVVNAAGIFLHSGQGASIVLTGPTVNVNNGALTVI